MSITSDPWVSANPTPPPEEVREDLHKAQELLKPKAPEPEAVPSLVFDLPRGYQGQRQCEVRELTGADEEFLARYKNPVDFFDGVLAVGVERIGTTNLQELPLDARMGILGGLLVGEREQLFLHICEATFGDVRTMGFVCNACGESSEVDLVISKDFNIPMMESPDQMTYEFTTSKGKKLTYRLAIGEDQREILSKKGLTSPEIDTETLCRCLVGEDGHPPVDPRALAQSLSVRDRKSLLDEMNAKQPVPDMGVIFSCPACHAEVTVNVEWSTLFRP